MALINVNPFVMKDSVFSVAADDYAAAITAMTITPTSSQITIKGLKPSATFSDATTPTWTCAVSYIQDWENEESFANYLFDHAGETVSATIEPVTGGTGWDVDLILTPGDIGGAVDAYGVATVTLGISGKPVRVPATP